MASNCESKSKTNNLGNDKTSCVVKFLSFYKDREKKAEISLKSVTTNKTILEGLEQNPMIIRLEDGKVLTGKLTENGMTSTEKLPKKNKANENEKE